VDVSDLAQLTQITGPEGRVPDDKKAAEQFEGWMVSFMAKQMRESVKDGPWSSGAMSTFADLFDQEIGTRVAESGGFGLQEDLLRSIRHPAGQPAEGPPGGHERAHAPVGAVEAHGLRVTSQFGLRADPFTGVMKEHHGLDLGAPEGTPVLAAAAGKVRFAGKRGGYGNVVIVEHADGTETRYAHCRELDVAAGQSVAAGQPIATVGSTGRSTGPHLHFEVRQGGKPVDPATWAGGGSPLGEKDR